MTQLFESKSLLAKLLAQENIIVEHRKVPTAYFDLKSRSMILPILKDMDDPNLYDLFVGHEVGHALYTPECGWHSALEENMSLKTYLNVCEDARIERKIKDKFPGLRRSFNLAYKKLFDMDFFGLNGLDSTKLRLIDRINIFYKLNSHYNVAFTQEELVYIDRINAAESWEEIEVIARELYARAVEEAKNKPKEESNVDDEELGSFDSLDIEEDFESEEFNEDYDYMESDDSDDSDGQENDEKHESNHKGNSYGNDDSETEDSIDDEEESDDEEDVSSVTDRAFRQNEKNLIDDSSGNVHVLNIPIPNRDSYFVGHKKVHAPITKKIDDILSSGDNSYHMEYIIRNAKKSTGLYAELLKRVNPVVNYMVKEFEMRKNATQLARAKVGKSGKINPKKLSRFSLDQDIFQRITTVPQGKNHGLVMFIDLSGSMTSILQRTFEQAILLTMFCKKVNIPFEVYGFSDHPFCSEYDLKEKHYPFTFSEKDLIVGHGHFYIKQYLSSTMNGLQYREAVRNMLYVGSAQHCGSAALPSTEILYGTPLDEAIVSSIELVSEFKNGYKLDIVNCIFLTDGQGGFNYNFMNEKGGHGYFTPQDTVYLQHKGSKNRVRLNTLSKDKRYQDYFMTTRGLIEIAKQVTGAKYTGYLLAHKQEIASAVQPYEYNYVDYNTSKEQRRDLYKKISDRGFYSSNAFGFNEYFFVEPHNLNVTEQSIDVPADAKKGAITKAFMKSLNNRGLQRMFLNKFVDNLAA